ncbi:hypothetical protein C5167_027497 [Papaver somniferum]|nr:hypothetical protein C5167_027497 [Papaver somniferum]
MMTQKYLRMGMSLEEMLQQLAATEHYYWDYCGRA